MHVSLARHVCDGRRQDFEMYPNFTEVLFVVLQIASDILVNVMLV